MPTPLAATADDLKNATVAALVDGLNGLIAGANADIQGYATAIANDAIEAGLTGRVDLLPALTDQATRVLPELNRVRFVAGMEATAFRVISVALAVATRVALPTIPTIPQL